jgi:hypothetical protein
LLALLAFLAMASSLYGGQASAQEFIVDAQSFIPYDHVFASLCNDVCTLTELYGGDNRGFGHPGYRTRQWVKVRTIGDPVVLEGPFNTVGVTKAYLCSAISDGTVTNDQPCQEATASNSNMSVSAQRIDPRTVQVTLQGSATNPLAPLGSPSIDWCYTVLLFTRQNGTSGYSITGGNDNFPSYEVIVNSLPIHQFAAPANDPTLLAGSCTDVPVAKSGDFPAAPAAAPIVSQEGLAWAAILMLIAGAVRVAKGQGAKPC